MTHALSQRRGRTSSVDFGYSVIFIHLPSNTGKLNYVNSQYLDSDIGGRLQVPVSSRIPASVEFTAQDHQQ